MSFENPTREQIGDILAKAGNIAVVGLSDKSDRTSYMVAYAMQSRGYRIIPVNPTVDGEILGEKCYHTLAEIPEPVDIVNVFRRSEFCAEMAQEAADIGARVLWLQQGIISQEAADIAAEHGMIAIMDRCIKVEEAVTMHGRDRA